MIDDPAPRQPMRRVRYYLGRCEDALDDATTALQRTPAVDSSRREEVMQDVAVLGSKLDILRTMMNGH
jgi:hypothetical protein